mmetsp:Transcript_439/g.3293  ORF Transcript_439/g.3293 Transcript_439/m.3293 type:complete len:223 (+) Transcript_439:3337-4005(+)
MLALRYSLSARSHEMQLRRAWSVLLLISSSVDWNSLKQTSMIPLAYASTSEWSSRGRTKLAALMKAERTFPLCSCKPSQRGERTFSNDSPPYGADASASAPIARAETVLTLTFSSDRQGSTISSMALRCGRTPHPTRMLVCWTTLIPVCLACHDFLLLQTAFKKGRRDEIPSALATTLNALAVVLRTYSSGSSMSGRMEAIMLATPAALARLEMTCLPSTLA